MKVTTFVLDGKHSPAHSECVEPTGPELSKCSTRSPDARLRPARRALPPPKPPGSLASPTCKLAQVPCVAQPAWKHPRTTNETRSLQRPRPLLGRAGPRAPCGLCPPAPAPPGTPVSARDPDRTRVGMHRGAGAAPAAHQRADPRARQTLLKAPSHPALAKTSWGNPVIPRETHLQEAGGQCAPPAMRGKHQRDHTQARWLWKLALSPRLRPLSLPSAVLSGMRQK